MCNRKLCDYVLWIDRNNLTGVLWRLRVTFLSKVKSKSMLVLPENRKLAAFLTALLLL